MLKTNKETAQKIIDEYCFCNGSTENLARKYNISQTNVRNIIQGKRWPECIRPKNIKYILKEKRNKGLVLGREHKKLPDLSEIQYDIITGSLLGDGHLTKSSKTKNSRLSKKQSKEKKEYLDWTFKELKEYSAHLREVVSEDKLDQDHRGHIVRKKIEKRLIGYSYSTYAHPNLTKLRNIWYHNNIKTVPKNLILTPRVIAIWYCDDGSNCVRQRTATICTQSFTFQEVENLIFKLNKLELFPSLDKIKSKYTNKYMPILKFRKESYDNLIALVKPFIIWPCFDYKTEWYAAKKQYEYSGKFTNDQIKKNN